MRRLWLIAVVAAIATALGAAHAGAGDARLTGGRPAAGGVHRPLPAAPVSRAQWDPQWRQSGPEPNPAFGSQWRQPWATDPKSVFPGLDSKSHRWAPRHGIAGAPVYVVPDRCWVPGYWSYQWVPRAYSYNVWVPGQWTPEGTWLDGHYESRLQPGYYQPYWVDGRSAGC